VSLTQPLLIDLHLCLGVGVNVGKFLALYL